MSSSIDYFDCPVCGRQASREQDNRTCEIHISCPCGYDGTTTITDKMVEDRIIQWLENDTDVKGLVDVHNHIFEIFPALNRPLKTEDIESS